MGVVRRATPLLLILFLGLHIQLIAFGQSQPETVVHVASSDHILGDDRVIINGTVANNLMVDVLEVEVTVVFENSTQATDTAETIIRYIQAEGSARFQVLHSFTDIPTSYSAYVSAYTLDSDDLDLMVTLFWDAEDDTALRRAAMTGVAELPSDRASEIAEKFSAVERPTAVEDLIEDLILLPLLHAYPSSDTATALLEAISRYNDPDYEAAFQLLLSSAEDEDTIIPLLNEAALENLELTELIGNALVATGDSSVPALLAATTDREKATLAEDVLQRLGRSTPEAQLMITLSSARLDIIDFYSQNYDPLLVKPLLDAAAFGEAERKAVVDTLDSWGTAIAPQLVEGLNARHPASRQLAEELLQRQATSAGPVVAQALTSEGWEATGDFETDLPSLLTVYADLRRERAAAILQQANAALNSSDCPTALAAFEQATKIDVALVPVGRMAESYACAGQLLNAIGFLSGHVQQNPNDVEATNMLIDLLGQRADELLGEGETITAAAYLEDAVAWFPEPIIQAKLATIYQQQGREARERGQYDEAVRLFRLSQEIDNSSEVAKAELGRTTIAAAPWLAAVGLISLCLGAFILSTFQRQREEGPQ